MKDSQPVHPGIILNAMEYLTRLCFLSKDGAKSHLEKQGVFIENSHFVYTNGGHGSVYVNIKALDTSGLIPIALQMAYEIHISGLEPDGIVAVPHGADSLAPLVALFYTIFSRKDVQILKLMKKGEKGFSYYKDHGGKAKGKRLALIEDVINTGESLVRCGAFIRNSGVDDFGCFVVCDRVSDKNPGLTVLGKEFGVEIVQALISVKVDNYSVQEGEDPRKHCPQCEAGIPINTQIGHGKNFLEKMEKDFPDFHSFIIANKQVHN